MLEYEVLHFVNKVCQSTKQGDTVQKSALECKIVWHSMELVWKVQKAIKNGYWLVIIIKIFCVNKNFCILLGFGYFDKGVSIYLWHCSFTLVVGPASFMLMDGAKQAGLVVAIN